MTTQHIPAWKRLGLKLKHAKETAPATASAVDGTEIGQKRKSFGEIGLEENGYQRKRSRVKTETSEDKLETNYHNTNLTSSTIKIPGKRKSVSFTADTKVQDGDSAQSIQFWNLDQPGLTAGETNGGANQEQVLAPLSRLKREKKPKSRQINSLPVKPRKATAALDYLDEFYHNRASWKFNKNHETWILKHALSLEQIPLQYTLALSTYIRGLQSAASRQRLIDQSHSALSKDDIIIKLDNEDYAKLRQLAEKAFAGLEPEAKIDAKFEQPSWLIGHHRGTVILLALDEAIQRPARQAQLKEGLTTRVKRNKSRTSRIDFDSSSSSESEIESESGSDSESDEDGIDISDQDSPAPFNSRKAPTAGGGGAEDTSSSGSSSESSSTTSSDSEGSSDSDSDMGPQTANTK